MRYDRVHSTIEIDEERKRKKKDEGEREQKLRSRGEKLAWMGLEDGMPPR